MTDIELYPKDSSIVVLYLLACLYDLTTSLLLYLPTCLYDLITYLLYLVLVADSIRRLDDNEMYLTLRNLAVRLLVFDEIY